MWADNSVRCAINLIFYHIRFLSSLPLDKAPNLSGPLPIEIAIHFQQDI